MTGHQRNAAFRRLNKNEDERANLLQYVMITVPESLNVTAALSDFHWIFRSHRQLGLCPAGCLQFRRDMPSGCSNRSSSPESS